MITQENIMAQGEVRNRDTDKRIGNHFAKVEESERRVVLPVRVKSGHLNKVQDGANKRNVKLSSFLDDVIDAGLLSEEIKSSNA